MGIVRKIIKALLTFFFSLFLALLVLTFIFYKLTAYENIKDIFITIFKDSILMNTTTQEVEEMYSSLSSYCKVNTNATIPMDNISLSCSEILNRDLNDVINLVAEKSFKNFYYKNYGCEFLECVKNIKSGEDFAVVFSLTAHKFFERILWPLVAITVSTGISLFFLIETWSGRFKTFGFEFLSIGIFFLVLPYFKEFLAEGIPKNIGENLLNAIFNQISSILLIFFLLGIVFIVAWVLTVVNKKLKKSK
jgi:hypothetical protein